MKREIYRGPTDTQSEYADWLAKHRPHKKSKYRGIRILKNPLDLFLYQEIIHQYNVHWVIECGCYYGGSTLYFADLLANRDANGFVIAIDNNPDRAEKGLKDLKNSDRIKYLGKDSVNPEVVEKTKKLHQPAPDEGTLLILDSNHKDKHVLKELHLYTPFLKKGDYVIVEDNATAGPIFRRQNPNKLHHDKSREATFGGATYAKNGFYLVK